MDYQVIWMDEAIADLKAIVLRIAQDHPDAARRWGEKILQKPRLLSEQPRLGHRFEKLGREDVRELNVPPYRIIYQVLDTTRTVWILTVWHGARQEPDLQLP